MEHKATAAQRAVAGAAATDAFPTEIVVAALAVVALVFVDNGAAVVAGRSGPVVQGHVGRVRVVGFQDGANEDEKVAEAAFVQGAMDRHGGVAFAQVAVADASSRRAAAGWCARAATPAGWPRTSSAPRRETRPHPENHDGTWLLTFREAALLGTADVIAP